MSTILQTGWDDYGNGRYAEAHRAAQAVLTTRPDQPLALALRAMCDLWLKDDVNGAVRTLKRVLKAVPNGPRLHQALGSALAFSGDLEGAEKSFLRALELQPDDFSTFHYLTSIRKHDRIEPFAARMIELLDQNKLTTMQQCPLHFALTKIYADMGEYESAMGHAIKANAATSGHYNPATSELHLDSLRKLRDEGGFRSLPSSGNGSAKPLFIVGPARSGTTLTETILGVHSQVRPCGEMPDIIRIERELINEMGKRAGKSLTALQAVLAATPEDLRPKAEAMLANAHAHTTGPYRLFTDKMPPNGLRLGLIARLFPNAKVIVMDRDPRDVAVSSLFARLHINYGYTRKQEWLGHYLNYYAAAVGLWKQITGLETFDLNYEQLTSDPEPTIRAMLDFAGLNFEAACLHPERSGKSVKTASVWQARQAINAKSVGRWKNYEPWLGPLFEALDKSRHLAKDQN